MPLQRVTAPRPSEQSREPRHSSQHETPNPYPGPTLDTHSINHAKTASFSPPRVRNHALTRRSTQVSFSPTQNHHRAGPVGAEERVRGVDLRFVLVWAPNWTPTRHLRTRFRSQACRAITRECVRRLGDPVTIAVRSGLDEERGVARRRLLGRDRLGRRAPFSARGFAEPVSGVHVHSLSRSAQATWTRSGVELEQLANGTVTERSIVVASGSGCAERRAVGLTGELRSVF